MWGGLGAFFWGGAPWPVLCVCVWVCVVAAIMVSGFLVARAEANEKGYELGVLYATELGYPISKNLGYEENYTNKLYLLTGLILVEIFNFLLE